MSYARSLGKNFNDFYFRQILNVEFTDNYNMRGYNLSIGKFALISTLTIFLIGISMASSLETASEEEVTSGEVNLNLEQASLSDYDSVKIGLWSNKNPKEREFKSVEDLMEGRASPGTNIELGLVFDSDDDGAIDLGDEVKFYDNGEEEIDYSSNPGFQAYRSPKGLTKVSVPTEVAGSYGLQRSDEFEIVKDANPGDTVELVRNEDNIFTKKVDLSEYIEGSGKVTLVSSERKTDAQDPELSLDIDVDSPEIVSAEKISSEEGKFQFTVSDEGEASIDENSIENVKENFEFEFYSATDGIDNVDQSVEEENVVFEVTLEEPLKNSDRITISNGESGLEDSVGNVIQSSQAKVENMNGRKPEIDTEFIGDINEPIVPREELKLSITAKDIVKVTEIEADLTEFDEGVKDLELEEINCDEAAEGIRCFEAETSFEFSGDENPSATITATDKNGNTDTKETETLEAKLNFEGLNSVTVQDNNEDIGIDTAIVDFKENIDPNTVSAEEWILKHPDGRKAFDAANVIDTDESKIKLTMDETPFSTTDSDDVDVIYEPGDNPLRGAEGFLIPRISMNDRDDIDEIDEAAPKILDIDAMVGYDHGVLRFSESIYSIKDSPSKWNVERVQKNGENTERAVAEFSGQINQDHIDGDTTWKFTASDEDSNQIQSESGMTESNLIGLNSGWNLVSLPEKGSIGSNTDADLSEDYSWIDSAFNYRNGWEIASSLTPNQGTYINADSAGVLEFKANDEGSPAVVPGDLADGWNLLSPFRFEGDSEEQKIGFFSESEICSDEDYDIVSTEPDQVENPCDGEEFNEKTSVFNGYWVQ